MIAVAVCKLYPERQLIALEPMEPTFRLLTWNLRENGCDHAIALPVTESQACRAQRRGLEFC